MNPKTKSKYPQIVELHFGEPHKDPSSGMVDFPHPLVLHSEIQPTTDVKYLERKFQEVL